MGRREKEINGEHIHVQHEDLNRWSDLEFTDGWGQEKHELGIFGSMSLMTWLRS